MSHSPKCDRNNRLKLRVPVCVVFDVGLFFRVGMLGMDVKVLLIWVASFREGTWKTFKFVRVSRNCLYMSKDSNSGSVPIKKFSCK